MSAPRYEVVVVGAGLAGLTGALCLARARRRVLVVDGGPPRNAPARALHGFPTRDGSSPLELLRMARDELCRYPGTELREARVCSVDGECGNFVLALEGAEKVSASRVLLCVGLDDELPSLPGCRELWGKAVFVCPYCHGFEVRDRELGYLMTDPKSLEFSQLLLAWSAKVRVFTDANFELSSADRAKLEQRGVAIEERKLTGLQRGEPDELVAVRTEDGDSVPCQALFVHPPQQQTKLVQNLGLQLNEHGAVQVSAAMETSRPGVSAAGDLAASVHLALAAAASGAVAGNSLVRSLLLDRV